jgi:uncharacterized membrane protein YgcG
LPYVINQGVTVAQSEPENVGILLGPPFALLLLVTAFAGKTAFDIYNKKKKEGMGSKMGIEGKGNGEEGSSSGGGGGGGGAKE